MDSNREEAERAFKLAESYQASDPQKSLKFARKACALYWSPKAAALVKTLETGEGPSSTGSNVNSKQSDQPPAGSSTARSTSAADKLRTRTSQTTPKPSTPAPKQNATSPPTYKPAQLEIVKKVRRCKVTQYYEILDLKRDCEESHVKSAYRKLALALHPDKNSAPGADEAFKMVSKAFQVLSDADKRAAFDRHGADPDSRSAGVPTSSSFGNGHTQFAYEDGIDPDQLFRMFFGGGGFDGPGMQFGGGPTVFQFGGGRTMFGRGGGGMWGQNINAQRTRQRQQAAEEVRTPTTWITFLPIIIFFVISLLQSFPALFSTPPVPDPNLSWSPSPGYSTERITHGSVGVRYFVNPVEFATHPFYEAYLKANPKLGYNPPSTVGVEKSSQLVKKELVQALYSEAADLLKKTPRERQSLTLPSSFKKFEHNIELLWARKLQIECRHARDARDSEKRSMMGFLGINADWEAIAKLDAQRIPACDGLRELGYALD